MTNEERTVANALFTVINYCDSHHNGCNDGCNGCVFEIGGDCGLWLPYAYILSDELKAMHSAEIQKVLDK